MNKSKLKLEIERLVEKASFSLRKDVYKLINKAYLAEKNNKAKTALSWILDNAKVAEAERLAICQDTGLPIIFIEIGKGIKISSDLIDIIKEGIESGYEKNYLRPSIVDPIKRGKPSYQGGVFHIDFSKNQKGLKITLFPKGFGSENKSRLRMFNPTVGIDKIEEFVLETVTKAGPEACPPFVVGVGIGGTSDHAILLAKKAFLSEIDKPNPDIYLNTLEKTLVKKINALKIGPMGLGGNTTCLAVKIKKVKTHIAGLPVGVNISCHALRSASVNFKRIIL
ncbi:MAG: fumarate hydratase [Candidatus Omnitrophica bacterium]|nr:fumarate hydratase [Candidatus Omnitrophota bacterium]